MPGATCSSGATTIHTHLHVDGRATGSKLRSGPEKQPWIQRKKVVLDLLSVNSHVALNIDGRYIRQLFDMLFSNVLWLNRHINVVVVMYSSNQSFSAHFKFYPYPLFLGEPLAPQNRVTMGRGWNPPKGQPFKTLIYVISWCRWCLHDDWILSTWRLPLCFLMSLRQSLYYHNAIFYFSDGDWQAWPLAIHSKRHTINQVID